MKKYRLEKLSVKEGKSSGVRAGSNSTGHCFYAEFDKDDKKVVDIESPTIEDIKVGGYLLVAENSFFFNKTSEITDIVESDDKSLTFETGTSVYKLEIF